MPAPRTEDGITIRAGLRVWTNNLARGVIGPEAPTTMPDPWYRVYLDDGGRDLMNACRLSTRHPFTNEAA